MKSFKQRLCLLTILAINIFSVSILAEEKKVKPISANPVKLDQAEVKNLKLKIKKTHLEYTNYMDILKRHREKSKDMQIVRTANNARARTNLRSQNSQWRGTYDCDDNDAGIKPGQAEVCDGKDNNCNGDVDEGVTANLFLDADGDGWGDSSKPILACHVEAGYAARGNDCDDRNIQIYPGAADVEGDGIDANCDGKDG